MKLKDLGGILCGIVIVCIIIASGIGMFISFRRDVNSTYRPGDSIQLVEGGRKGIVVTVTLAHRRGKRIWKYEVRLAATEEELKSKTVKPYFISTFFDAEIEAVKDDP